MTETSRLNYLTFCSITVRVSFSVGGANNASVLSPAMRIVIEGPEAEFVDFDAILDINFSNSQTDKTLNLYLHFILIHFLNTFKGGKLVARGGTPSK